MRKVAVVEGDLFLRNMYVTKLRNSGLHVRSAGDGLEAFKMLKNFDPHLVIMDLKLPGMSGAEVIRKYLRHHPDKSPKILMASNLDEHIAMRMLDDVPSHKYIIKAHHTPSELVKMIGDLLKLDVGLLGIS